VASSAADAIECEPTALAEVWRTERDRLTRPRGRAIAISDGEKDYWDYTGEALDNILASTKGADVEVRARFMQNALKLDCFADAGPAAAAIKKTGRRIALLTNATSTMAVSALKTGRLGKVVNEIIACGDQGVLKPDPAAYALATARLRIAPAAICYVSADGWDASAGADAGFQVVWLNRGQDLGAPPRSVGLKIATLTELPALIED
jgi:2-haloalkanoic acid dehalogenase type II